MTLSIRKGSNMTIEKKCESCGTIISGNDLKVCIDEDNVKDNERYIKNFKQLENKFPNKDVSSHYPRLHKTNYFLCPLCKYKNYF